MPPPDERWEAAPNGRFVVHRDNADGIIEIYRKRGDPRPIWSADLSGFDPIFSITLVTADGKALVHLRDNHIIKNRDALAVEIIRQDGRHFKIPASRFVYDLVLHYAPRRLSTIPRHYWYRSIDSVLAGRLTLGTSKHLVLTTGCVRSASIDLRSGGLTLTGRPDWAAMLHYRCLEGWGPLLPYSPLLVFMLFWACMGFTYARCCLRRRRMMHRSLCMV